MVFLRNVTHTRQVVIIEPPQPDKFFVKTFNSICLYVISLFLVGDGV